MKQLNINIYLYYYYLFKEKQSIDNNDDNTKPFFEFFFSYVK